MTRAALTFAVVVALVLLALALTPPTDTARYPYLPTPASAPTCAPALGMEPA